MRYLAAAGPPEALARLSCALAGALAEPGRPEFVPVLAAPGLSVWTVPGTPVVPGEDGRSAAVGLLFERDGGHPVTNLPAPLPAEAAFTARFWGAYVLFAGEGQTRHAVLRDPSGNVTAYHLHTASLDLYASDADLLAAAAPALIVPDPEFLRQWLTYPFLRAGLAGWSGASELVPGTERRVVDGDARVTAAWSPWDHARSDLMIEDPAAASARLREAVLLAVPRLAGAAADPVVRLSGGLDSAIVAAALHQAGVPFRAATFATRAQEGDERAYARAAACRWDIALAELAADPPVPDFAHPGPRALRPPANAVLQQVHALVEAHLAATGADLVIGGTGGDNVFCYLGSASPVLDALRSGRLRAALASTSDLARLHGTTVRAVARAAYRRSRRAPAAWRRDESFLARGAAAAAPAPHPWLDAPAGALRGKLEQVQSIVSVRHFLTDPGPGRTPAIHPLLAQPVLEACLRIPTWLWMQGGRDRAMARAAFADLLPQAILSRRSKGSLGSLVMAGYLAGRAQLEDLLLEGRLADLGLIDRDAVAAYLRRSAEPEDPGHIRLLDMAAAEAWLRAF